MFRTYERIIAQDPEAYSRPLDLAQLDARLLKILSNDEPTFAHEQSIADSSTLPDLDVIERGQIIKHETKAYKELVQMGGRPLYLIDEINDVLDDPERYRDLLRPWQDWPHVLKANRIFREQLQRWKDFRKWQNDNRGLDDDDGGYLAFVERKKTSIKEEYWEDRVDSLLAKIERDPSYFKEEWDDLQSQRRQHRRIHRERDCHSFHDYFEAANRRLLRHNFTLPVQLDEDPKKQNKLTTWIEYLEFECWWLDRYIQLIEHAKPVYDEAWQELVDLKVLKPHETQEYLRTVTSSNEQQREVDQTREDVKRETSNAERIYMKIYKDPEGVHIPPRKCISMMKAVTARLRDAKARRHSAWMHSYYTSAYIDKTNHYMYLKREAARQELLVGQIMGQVSSVEAEMIQSQTHEDTPDIPGCAKRRLEPDENEPLKRTPKRQKLVYQESLHANNSANNVSKTGSMPPETCGISKRTASQCSKNQRHSTRRSHETTRSHSETDGLRRSARIAAYSETNVPRRSARVAARSANNGSSSMPEISQTRLRYQSYSQHTGPFTRSPAKKNKAAGKCHDRDADRADGMLKMSTWPKRRRR